MVLREAEVLRNPDNAELARRLGLRRPEPDRGVFDLLVVGAGPAGLAAAVYGASDGLTVSAVEAHSHRRSGGDDVTHRELSRLPIRDFR